MSVLRMKSKINQEAAAHLLNRLYFPPVVHCAYYSCVQLMRHILLFEKGWSDWEMEKERRRSGLGSHQYLINKICNELKQMNISTDFFFRRIIILKQMRVTADYQSSSTSRQESRKSINLSESIITYLKNCFEI